MKRMVCLISDQILPNFIPVNEPATRPDALHAIFTPGEDRIKRNWENLRKTVAGAYPRMSIVEAPIDDAYDAREIRRRIEDLFVSAPDDEWSLNATGGTKPMSAAATEMFNRKGYDVYYVESLRNRTLKVAPDWEMAPIPFTETLDIKTYFQLYGQDVSFNQPRTGQENQVYRQLKQLDWLVESSVVLRHNGQILNEYDAIGVHYYQCSAFECKDLNDLRSARVKGSIYKDLLKLYHVQQHFGGPFGKSYWVFSGSHKLSPIEEERIRLFKIILIRGDEINRIAIEPKQFKLPALRKQ